MAIRLRRYENILTKLIYEVNRHNGSQVNRKCRSIISGIFACLRKISANNNWKWS